MIYRSPLFGLACAALAIAAPAGAAKPGSFDGMSRAGLTAILRGMAMKVEDKTDGGGTPWLVVTTKEGDVFNVMLYVCDAHTASSKCEQIQFRMTWDNTKGLTPDAVNKFHNEKVFGRGFVSDDGKVVGVEYPLNLKYGVTAKNFRENVDYFLRVTVDFAEIVNP